MNCVRKGQHINPYFVAVRLKFDAILEMKVLSTEVMERDIHDVLGLFALGPVPCSSDSRNSSFCNRSCNRRNKDAQSQSYALLSANNVRAYHFELMCEVVASFHSTFVVIQHIDSEDQNHRIHEDIDLPCV